MKADIDGLQKLRKQITGKQRKAQRLTTDLRAAHSIKEVDPKDLTDVPPSADGYQKIMDFYRFTVCPLGVWLRAAAFLCGF